MYKLIAITAVCAGALLGQTATAQAPVLAQTIPDGQAPTGAKTITTIRAGSFNEFGPIGITAALAGPTANIQGAPYSAQVETQRVQILADGNRIEQTTSGSVARDSHGRVRREESLPALEPNAGDAPHLTFIEDPVAGVHWTLDPRTKTAMKMPFGPVKASAAAARTAKTAAEMGTIASAGPGMPPPPPPPGAGQVFFYSSTLPPNADMHVMKLRTEEDAQVTKTDLGTQDIEGVPAKGTKTTRTIPAGRMGNSLPIVITTETWFSPDLKVLVLSKVNDPRMGETTYKLTNIQRVEPAPSLFEPPADYAVKEGTNNIVFQTKKP